VSTALSQRYEDGWKGIKPLVSNRASVNTILGTPDVDIDGFYFYRSEDAFIRVNYSSTPCAKISSPRFRSAYNVPEWTVLDYYVIPSGKIKLSESGIDITKYQRDTSGDFITAVDYWPYVGGSKKSTSNGFSFSTNRLEGTEYLRQHTYKPFDKELKKKKCPAR
jgi:hypothetical protein